MSIENQPTLGSIQIFAGPFAGRTFPIHTTTISIGRDTNNDIVIPDQAVSRPMQPSNVTPKGTQVALPVESAGTSIPSLEISTNTGRAKQTYQLTKPVINIGRDSSNEIVINEPTVSSFHAQIVREENQL